MGSAPESAALDIVGGSVACLLAALEAAQRGRKVRLHLAPGRAGGSFAGITVAGRRLNLGFRLFELDYEDPPEARLPIAAFAPDRHNHRPFIDAVAARLRDLLGDDLVPAADPEMWLAGRRSRCVHFTADLTGLAAALPLADRTRIAAEVEALLADPAPPSWRFLPGRAASLEDVDLATASLANHGARFHALLVETHCARQYAGWAEIAASERRKLWVALFHPTTLREALRDGRPSFRAYRPFATTRSGSMAPLIERMMAAIAAEKRIEIVPAGRLVRFACEGARARLDFAMPEGAAHQVELSAGSSVIGVPPEELFAAAGIAYAPEKIRSSFAWVEAREEDVLHRPSLLSIHDPEIGVLRVSTGGEGTPEGWCLFTVEFGAAAPSEAAARHALTATGLVRAGAELRLVHQLTAPAQTAPSFANRRQFAAARREFAALGWEGTVFGAARRFGFDSLNDGIAEALHFGETRC